MNKFILLKAKDMAAYDKALDRLSRRSIGTLPFYPDRIRVREFPENLAIFANFEITNTGGFEKHYVHTAEKHTFAFDGLPFWKDLRADGNWAAQVDQMWVDDDRTLQAMFGTWALARFGQGGGHVLSDFSGMTPLFYWKSSEFFAVSPRQMLLNAVCTDQIALNMEALSWLSGQANLFGQQMPWENTFHLPPQWTLTISPKRGDLEPRLIPREIWSKELDPTPDPERFERAKAAILAQMDAMSKLPMGEVAVDITGGLDSRLVAVLLLNSNLRSRVKTLQTAGPENGHEIQVGRAVAKYLGVEHHERIATPRQFHPKNLLDDVRARVFRTEASVCPNDGASGAGRESNIVFTGSAGEIYRRHCKPHMKLKIATRQELAEVFQDYHQKTDPLGIQVSEITKFQKKYLSKLALSYHDAGVDLNDVTDVFFMRYRLPLWNGIMMNNLSSSYRLYPLVNYELAKYAFSLGFEARVNDRIHFELLSNLCPELCEMPFLKYTWPEEYSNIASSYGITLPRKPFPVEGPNNVSQQSGPLQVMVDEGWTLMKDYLFGWENSNLWDIIDRERLVDLFDKGRSGFHGVVPYKQMFALLGMQASINQDYLLRRDGVNASAPHLDGTLAKRMFS